MASAWSSSRVLLGDRRALIWALILCSVAFGVAESGFLAILAQVAAALVSGSSRVHIQIGPLDSAASLRTLLVVGFALAFMRLGLLVVISHLPARIAADVQGRVRNELFAAFTSASWAVQSRDREGHLQELMTNQSWMATSGAMYATALITSLLTLAMLVVSALALNVAAALIVLTAAVVLSALLRPFHKLSVRHAEEWSRAGMGFASGVGEAVRLAEATKTFGVASAQRKRVEMLEAGVQDALFRAQRIARLVPGVYQGAMYILVLAGLATLYASGFSHVASLGAVVLVLVRAGSYGQQTQTAYQSLLQALPYVERIQSIRRRYAESVPPAGTRRLERVDTLAFEHVSFAYETDRPVISDINFETAARDTIGIVGPSGAGKSTLVQILLGLRAPDHGRYLVNGVPAQEFVSQDWHRHFAYVPQEPQLLHASVAENISFFREISDEDIERAARLAGIHDDIVKWPHGYATTVGPRADAVSGGQQQRICLARALAARPAVLVLDEPTSALDPHSELIIQKSLDALRSELTVFVVAHRMSTLDICDKVMVIVDGQLDAFASATALSDHNDYFRSASALARGGVLTTQ